MSTECSLCFAFLPKGLSSIVPLFSPPPPSCMLMHAYLHIRHPCKPPSENPGYRLGWNLQKPAKQDGNDTTTLLHHLYILCYVPTMQTMKLSMCTLAYSHPANESFWVHTVTPFLCTEFSLHKSCTLGQH